MARKVASLLLILLLLGLSLGSALAQKDEPDVKISPNTINEVADRSGRKLTVHANTPYASVYPATSSLRLVECGSCGPIAPSSTFADDQGDLVAKFRMDDVLARLSQLESHSAGKVTLEFTVETHDNGTFTGTDDIHVVTCRRANTGASLTERDGVYKWGRSFSRVCEPEGSGGGG